VSAFPDSAVASARSLEGRLDKRGQEARSGWRLCATTQALADRSPDEFAGKAYAKNQLLHLSDPFFHLARPLGVEAFFVRGELAE